MIVSSNLTSPTQSPGRLDRLSALIERFRISAELIPVEDNRPTGEANFIVTDAGERRVVFCPGDSAVPLSAFEGETLVAGAIGISGAGAQVFRALPQRIEPDLKSDPELASLVEQLIFEAQSLRCGVRAIFQRLCEIVVIRLLRLVMREGRADIGLIAGLANPRLAAALVAIHERPSHLWSLEDLAAVAGMSRTSFATTFKRVLGVTPGGYLSQWRLEIAREELGLGAPVKAVAAQCGFTSAAGFSRAFIRHFGIAPREVRGMGR